MRKQYHFRQVDGALHIWDVDLLVSAASELPVRRIPLAEIAELDEPYWFEPTGHDATCRRVLEHARLVQEADLSHPIILSSDGRVMDGMHRVGKALLHGRREIDAVRFEVDPEPHFVDRDPEDLPY